MFRRLAVASHACRKTHQAAQHQAPYLVRHRLCSTSATAQIPRPTLNVVDEQWVQVIPNKLAVRAQACDLVGLPSESGEERVPYWYLQTKGMPANHSAPELAFVRPRDLMRPRDHTMVLGLLEAVYRMVEDGNQLDETATVPLETHRRKQAVREVKRVGPDGFDAMQPGEASRNLPAEEEIDCWLHFYAHPLREDGPSHMILLPPDLHRLTTTFSTPLRASNLLFKHNLWHYLPPAVYKPVAAPSEDLQRGSVLYKERPSETLLNDIPGCTVTMDGRRCVVTLPRSHVATLRERAALPSDKLIVVASRHVDGIGALLCWDPDRPDDSFIVATTKGEAGSGKLGATFASFTPGTDGGMALHEDGLSVTLSRQQYNELLSAITSGQDFDDGPVVVKWVGGAASKASSGEEDDWLSYIKGKINATEPAAAPSTPPAKPAARCHDAEEIQMDRVKGEDDVVQMPTVDPRLIRAEFVGRGEQDSRAQDPAWEQYVIRVATVISTVLAHVGKRQAPSPESGAPPSIIVEVIPTEGYEAHLVVDVDVTVCSIYADPEGINILRDRLNKLCSTIPAPLHLKLFFSA